MYITINQLAQKINNIERFSINEMISVYEIEILDDYNNIIYRQYVKCSKAQAETKAESMRRFYQDLDKCNYHYKVYFIK